MLNHKLYKPTLQVDDITIYIPNSKILTGKCGREIIAHQNKLDLNSLAHKNKIANITYFSIKYN